MPSSMSIEGRIVTGIHNLQKGGSAAVADFDAALKLLLVAVASAATPDAAVAFVGALVEEALVRLAGVPADERDAFLEIARLTLLCLDPALLSVVASGGSVVLLIGHAEVTGERINTEGGPGGSTAVTAADLAKGVG